MLRYSNKAHLAVQHFLMSPRSLIFMFTIKCHDFVFPFFGIAAENIYC